MHAYDMSNTCNCVDFVCWGGRRETELRGGVSSHVLTWVIFAIEVASVASVHPPSRRILEGTVAVVLVVVAVGGAELHAIVNGVSLVTSVIPEVKAIEGVSCIAAEVVAICQTVLILLCSNSEHGVVGIPGEKD